MTSALDGVRASRLLTVSDKRKDIHNMWWAFDAHDTYDTIRYDRSNTIRYDTESVSVKQVVLGGARGEYEGKGI